MREFKILSDMSIAELRDWIEVCKLRSLPYSLRCALKEMRKRGLQARR